MTTTNLVIIDHSLQVSGLQEELVFIRRFLRCQEFLAHFLVQNTDRIGHLRGKFGLMNRF